MYVFQGEKFLYLKEEHKTSASPHSSSSYGGVATTPSNHVRENLSPYDQRTTETNLLGGGVSSNFNSVQSHVSSSPITSSRLSSPPNVPPSSYPSSVPYSSSLPPSSIMPSSTAVPMSNSRYTGMPPSNPQSSFSTLHSPSSSGPYSTRMSIGPAPPRPPIQNGGSPTVGVGGVVSNDFQPEHKSLSPQHRVTQQQNGGLGGLGSSSRSPQSPLVSSSPSRVPPPPPPSRVPSSPSRAPPSPSRAVPSSSRVPPTFARPPPTSTSPLHSPVSSRNNPVPPPIAASFPTSSFLDHYQQHGPPNHLSPPSSTSHHSSKSSNRKGAPLEISSPITVHSLSNGSAMADSSDLQRITADLENFGKTGIFSDSFFGSSPVTSSSPLASSVSGTLDVPSRPVASSSFTSHTSTQHYQHPQLSESKYTCLIIIFIISLELPCVTCNDRVLLL